MTSELTNKVSFSMLKPFTTTGIGSLPHTDAREACRLVLETFDIPFWPQLPQLSFRESMIPQFSEALPFIKIDDERKNIRVERNGSDALTQFYETYSEDWIAPISEDYAKGFHTFIELIRNKKYHSIKGQVTGPLTFTLGLKDQKGRPIYFDEELREISLMLLKAKTKWQLEVLKTYADEVLIFVDEPILSALGSTSYLGVEPQEAMRLLKELSDSIKLAGGISGTHCCGKADWPLVTGSGTTIVSFDAYEYAESISLYPEDFTEFLKADGYLAWGIIPTTEVIREESLDSLKRRFDTTLGRLSKSVPEALLLSRILLTPSCGTGSRSIEETVKVFQLLKALKESLE